MEVGLGQIYWEKEFHKIHFPGMDLMEVEFFRPITPQEFAEKYEYFLSVKTDFLKMLGTEKEEGLKAFEFSDEQINQLKNGILPRNFVVHIKYPFEYGGLINFENMVLIQQYPYHQNIHSYLSRQITGENGIEKPLKLYVPTPVGKVYAPYGGGSTGGGGQTNATETKKKVNTSAIMNQGMTR